MPLPEPYYQDDQCTIYCGDCREIVPLLSEDEISCTIADPPYGSTCLEWDQWQSGWMDALKVAIGKSVWCFGTARLFFEHHDEFSGWNFAQEVIWEKQNGTSLHNDRFRVVHENIWQLYPHNVFWSDLYHDQVISFDAPRRRFRRQQKPAHWGQLASAGLYEVEEGGPRLMRSVIYCKNEHRKALHPTQKPIGVLVPLIQSSCPEGGVVLDPFMGSGSTLVAAREIKRKAVGIDADERWCEAAKNRLSQELLAF